HSAESTEELAKEFAQLLPADTTLALEGDLGVGKTTFVRGLVKGFGITEDITSPSFSLLNVYKGKRMIFHVDAYRLTQASSFDDLMIWDAAVSPWNVIVEWPEKVAARLPRSLWKLKATILADGGHQFTLSVN
ncbi:MAG: tRNA (adenosine(37)-N6)-threonylcarbamoyltransferase complex ATPase subunit type 1 TsaE, partial [Opitutae bacterium]